MTNTVVKELATLLADEQTTLEALLKVLGEETEALIRHDITAIEKLAQSKKQLLPKFQQHVQARLDYLSTHQLETDEKGFEQFLYSLENPSLESQWNTIKNGFRSVIEQNEKNGIVITHSRHKNRSLMNILHGNKNKPDLYSKSGSSKGSSTRHRLGEA
jgi:flagellar biosynthesis/type III secretory pathway chaperone